MCGAIEKEKGLIKKFDKKIQLNVSPIFFIIVYQVAQYNSDYLLCMNH